MKKVNLIQGSLKELMKNPKFKETHFKLRGKFDRQRNRLRKKFIMKKYWK